MLLLGAFVAIIWHLHENLLQSWAVSSNFVSFDQTRKAPKASIYIVRLFMNQTLVTKKSNDRLQISRIVWNISLAS